MCLARWYILGVRKKPKNRENKKKPKKPNHEKKPIKILQKPTGSVRFRFYKPETEKTESNPNRAKPF